MIVNPQQLKTYHQATKISTQILRQLYEAIEPGLYPIEVDQLAGELCQQHGVKPAFKGVENEGKIYQHNSCISVNDEILHGIPDDKRTFQEGDLVKVDFGVIHQGLFTDHCFTVGLGEVSAEDLRLMKVARKAVLQAVEKAQPGNHTGDLGHQMHQTAFRAGFDVFKQYIGHGIGHSLHETPEIPAFGKPQTGQLLQKNMIICVECQVVPGSDQNYVAANGWTVKTSDGEKGAMFEYMVRVNQKPEILTPTQDWALVKNRS